MLTDFGLFRVCRATERGERDLRIPWNVRRNGSIIQSLPKRYLGQNGILRAMSTWPLYKRLKSMSFHTGYEYRTTSISPINLLASLWVCFIMPSSRWDDGNSGSMELTTRWYQDKFCFWAGTDMYLSMSKCILREQSQAFAQKHICNTCLRIPSTIAFAISSCSGSPNNPRLRASSQKASMSSMSLINSSF